MDARVTKQRLGNMLSYDWLKILCTIAVAVAGLVLFFTMVSVRPARAQNFIVHFYGDYNYGSDYLTLKDVLGSELSYDVLYVEVDTFGTGAMDGAAYTARRSSGEGTVALASDYSESEDGSSFFRRLVSQNLYQSGTPAEALHAFYRLDEYFEGLESYLVRFFGEDWKNGTIDGAEAEKCFRARNVDGPNNKNRYRTEAQIQAGIEDEKARLEELRTCYIYLLDFGLGTEKLPYTDYTSQVPVSESETEERVYTVGVNIGKLTGIDRLVSYSGANGAAAREKLNFLIYNNGEESFENGTNDGRADLRYEAVVFLKYLVEHYK